MGPPPRRSPTPATPGSARRPVAPRGRRCPANRPALHACIETAAAIASSASRSCANNCAVRPSAARTPPPRTSSNSGNTSRRSRTRVKAGSRLCGSCHGVRPAARQAASVVSLVTPSNGRPQGRRYGRIPAIDRGPEPRARPSSTVSAWSSAVCANSTAAGPPGPPTLSASRRNASYLARRAAASGPPGPDTCTVSTSTSRQPIPVSCSTTAAACRAEPACSPWSTVAPTTRRSPPDPAAACCAAAARASESAPPEQATMIGSAGDRWPANQVVTADVIAAADEAFTPVSRVPAAPTPPDPRSPPWSAGCPGMSRRH